MPTNNIGNQTGGVGAGGSAPAVGGQGGVPAGNGGNPGSTGGSAGSTGGSVGTAGGNAGTPGSNGGTAGKVPVPAGAGGSTPQGGNAGSTPDAGVVPTDAPVVPPLPAETVHNLCSLHCSKLGSCGVTNDLQICIETCKNTNAALLAKLDEAVARSVMDCFKATECSRVKTDPNLPASCLQKVLQTRTTEVAPKEFCTAYYQRADQCNHLLNRVECENNARAYNGNYLSNATSCLARSCAEYDTCVNVLLSGAQGTYALLPTFPKLKKCVGDAVQCSGYSRFFGSAPGDVETCNAQMSCVAYASCKGTASCSGRTQLQCSQDSGCHWNIASVVGYCSGDATAVCTTLESFSACLEVEGCHYSLACDGPPRYCPALSPAACISQLGCRLQ